MEDQTMLEPIVKRVAGLDVHKMVIVATVLLTHEDGVTRKETREFGTFRKHRRQLARWLTRCGIELVVMESTGIFWKSIFETLEKAAIKTYVVNARHVKNVPGRKTDVMDSEWLATLARAGLLKPSFIPPKDLRELRLIGRHRMKLHGMLAGEKNRLHKILDDAGIRLGGVVSDINGVSAREMVAGLIENKPVKELVQCARGRLKAKMEELSDSLSESISERHRFLLRKVHAHIRSLENEIKEMDDYLFKAMTPYQEQWGILQTLPGVDKFSSAMLLIEIGTDMEQFGSSGHLASWAGMCPGNNESAGKRKNGRARKGNRSVRRVLCEVANAARKTNSQFKGKYQSLVIRRGHKRTIIALGHKILRVIYSMLKNNQPYWDPGIDYEALTVRRNAPRWLRALNKYGYLPAEA
jgi:transposase